MKFRITTEKLKRASSNPTNGHYRIRIDVIDDDGTEHHHNGQDASPARALALAAYHWHKYAMTTEQGTSAPLWPIDAD